MFMHALMFTCERRTKSQSYSQHKPTSTIACWAKQRQQVIYINIILNNKISFILCRWNAVNSTVCNSPAPSHISMYNRKHFPLIVMKLHTSRRVKLCNNRTGRSRRHLTEHCHQQWCRITVGLSTVMYRLRRNKVATRKFFDVFSATVWNLKFYTFIFWNVLHLIA